MGEGFVALTPGGNEKRVATDDGVVRSLARTRLENTLPQDRFRIAEIALDEQFGFILGSSEIDDGHAATETVEDVIPGTDDAAGGVEHEFALGVLFESGEDFVEDVDFFREILGFALGIGGAVGPAHPSRDTVDAGVAAGFEN